MSTDKQIIDTIEPDNINDTHQVIKKEIRVCGSRYLPLWFIEIFGRVRTTFRWFDSGCRHSDKTNGLIYIVKTVCL